MFGATTNNPTVYGTITSCVSKWCTHYNLYAHDFATHQTHRCGVCGHYTIRKPKMRLYQLTGIADHVCKQIQHWYIMDVMRYVMGHSFHICIRWYTLMLTTHMDCMDINENMYTESIVYSWWHMGRHTLAQIIYLKPNGLTNVWNKWVNCMCFFCDRRHDLPVVATCVWHAWCTAASHTYGKRCDQPKCRWRVQLTHIHSGRRAHHLCGHTIYIGTRIYSASSSSDIQMYVCVCISELELNMQKRVRLTHYIHHYLPLPVFLASFFISLIISIVAPMMATCSVTSWADVPSNFSKYVNVTPSLWSSPSLKFLVICVCTHMCTHIQIPCNKYVERETHIDDWHMSSLQSHSDDSDSHCIYEAWCSMCDITVGQYNHMFSYVFDRDMYRQQHF